MEPPGEDVPRDPDAPEVGTLRLTAAVVTVALALVAHGPLALLAAGAALTLASPAGAAVAALAALASYLRWGTGWLVAVGGAQAVLGPAVTVGPATAAASAVLASAALLLSTTRSVLAAVAVGTTAALLAWGPAGGDGAPARLVATAVCVVAAFGLSRLPHLRLRTVAALVASAAAVGLAI